jgi:hypothetical protein
MMRSPFAAPPGPDWAMGLWKIVAPSRKRSDIEGSFGEPAIWVWNVATTIERTSGFHHRYRGRVSDADQPGSCQRVGPKKRPFIAIRFNGHGKGRISDVRFIQDTASRRRDPLSMLTLLVAADDAGWGDRDYAIPRTCSRILRGGNR